MDDEAMHYGTKPGHFETLKIHFPTSEGVSEVSERANEWAKRRARAKQAVRSKQMSERCERMKERTSEWPSAYVSILVCSRPQCRGSTAMSYYLQRRKTSTDIMTRHLQILWPEQQREIWWPSLLTSSGGGGERLATLYGQGRIVS